jgi:SAM-dependent methyltransferase
MPSDSPDGLDRFVSRHPPRSGRTLVVGSKVYGKKQDRRQLYRKAIGVDLFEGEGVDFVHDLEAPLPESAGKFKHVDCVSVLEHVKRPWLMAANIEDALVEGGTLLVCVPFIWRVHAYPDDYWRMTASALEVLFPNIQWQARKYLVEGQARNLVRGKRDPEGRWMARAELAAMGVKCSSMS